MGRSVEYDNPFCQGEISNLGYAREENDLEYLKEWSREAVIAYEAYRNTTSDEKAKAAKWDKLIKSLEDILDRDDRVNLEYGPE